MLHAAARDPAHAVRRLVFIPVSKGRKARPTASDSAMVSRIRHRRRWVVHAATGAAALVALVAGWLVPRTDAQRDTTGATELIRPGGRVGSVAVADLDKDGNADVVAARLDTGTLWVYLGDGQGRFRAAAGSPFAAGPSPEDIAIADFNRDGRLDVVVTNHDTNHVTMLLGEGTGRLTVASNSPVRVGSRPHQHGLAVGDFDGDGDADLALDSRDDDAVFVLAGDGRGGLAGAPQRQAVGRAPYWRVRAGDVNGDNRVDIVTTNSEGASITLLLSNPRGFIARHIPTDRSPFAAAIGDVNGDRHADIAVAHYRVNPGGRDRVTVLLGDGSGAFTPAAGSPFPTGQSSTAVAIGDANGDEVGDVVVANIASNDVTLIYGSSSGLHEAAGSPLRVGEGPTAVTVADLDGDRDAEIITANWGSGDVTIRSSR